jgi:hypothetical protein
MMYAILSGATSLCSLNGVFFAIPFGNQTWQVNVEELTAVHRDRRTCFCSLWRETSHEMSQAPWELWVLNVTPLRQHEPKDEA